MAEETEWLHGFTMGTSWKVCIRETKKTEGLRGLIQERLDALEEIFSTYLPDSEISRFNKAGLNEEIELSPEMSEVLWFSLKLADVTGGRFDPTVFPLLKAKGLGAPQGIPPLGEGLFAVGWKHLDLNVAKRRCVKKAAVEIDLSACAKGYAVDEICQLLADHGCHEVLVEIGGDLRVVGQHDWRVGIREYDRDQPVVRPQALRNAAVAGSGLDRGRKGADSHLVDGRTRRFLPASNEVVAVQAGRCMVADGLATAVLLLGKDGIPSMKLLDDFGGRVVRPDDSR